MGTQRKKRHKARVLSRPSALEHDHQNARSRIGPIHWRAWDAIRKFTRHRINVLLLAYLGLYSVFGVLTVGFYPSYAWPGGDESTYYDRALHPWTLVGDTFEGYPPMELVDPYSPRIFLLPISAVFVLFGFTVIGARLVIFAYGLALLYVTYLIGCHVMSRAWSLMCVVLLSWSPQFVAHTHAVRQEGLLTLTIMIGVWLILRSSDQIERSTLFCLGAMGTASVMIHHNGIVLAPIFFVAAITYDFRALRWKKLISFAFGCGVASAVFLLVDFLPGLKKVMEYGIMPVLYVSHGRIPLLQGSEFPALVGDSIRRYAGFFQGFSAFEPHTPWFTASLLLPALFGLCYRSGRKERLLGMMLLLLCAALVAVVPNSQFRYLFYLCPLTFLLAIVGLAKLSANRFLRGVSITFLLALLGIYGYERNDALRRAWANHIENRIAAQTLRKLIADVGEPADVTIMGPGELHATAHDTRYRSFHSLIQSKDFGVSLRQIKPDIVVLYPRSTRAMILYVFDPNFNGTDESSNTLSVDNTYRLLYKGFFNYQGSDVWEFDREALAAQFAKDLKRSGYELATPSPVNWNGIPLDFYVKNSTGGTSMSRPSSVSQSTEDVSFD